MKLTLRSKIFANTIKRNAAIIAIVFVIISIFIFNGLNKWHDVTVSKNSVLCDTIAAQLLLSSQELIDYYGGKLFYSRSEIKDAELTVLDSTLAIITTKLLEEYEGVEGGFFLANIKKFIGYSYPTSPPPKPSYGPPPRSFQIIKDQCLKTIYANEPIVDIHGFDPAVFPLATVPILYLNKEIGAIWVRIHIERELPLVKLQSVVNVALLIIFIALLVLLWFFYGLRINIQSIRTNLELIHQNPAHRLYNTSPLFSGIANSINQTMEKMHLVSQHKQQLECELLQREKMASIGRIVAGVAHEVRTPLAIIKTRVQMWQQLQEENIQLHPEIEYISQSSMQLVIDETNRLSNLIKKLLLFSKPINKKMVKTNIRDFLNEVVNILQVQKETPNIIFQFNCADIPEIEIDRNSIYQVFINVIANSMEAMPNEGTITINLYTSEDQKDLNIEIIDQGIGIPDEILDKIFELFVTSKTTGVGLGLSISNEIVKAHHGVMRYENMKEGGAKCTIVLPVKQNS